MQKHITGQRTQDNRPGLFTHKWDTYINAFTKIREYLRREGRKNARVWQKGDVLCNGLVWIQHSHCTYELTVAMLLHALHKIHKIKRQSIFKDGSRRSSWVPTISWRAFGSGLLEGQKESYCLSYVATGRLPTFYWLAWHLFVLCTWIALGDFLEY